MTAATADSDLCARPPLPGLTHSGFLYRDDLGYGSGIAAFVREGLERGEPVLVAVPGARIELVRESLGADAAYVQLVDMAVAGRNPGRLIGALLAPFVQEHPGQRVRIVSEPVWPGRSEEEYAACVVHDALVGLALGDAEAEVLCPYDRPRLGPAAVGDATRTHRVLTDGVRRWSSPTYLEPTLAARALDRALPEPPEEAEAVVLSSATGPRYARALAHCVAERAGMALWRLADLRRIAQELAVNTAVHSGGRGVFLAWATEDEVRVEMRDGGRITDPLVGRRAPGLETDEHGLWLVNQLADLVHLHHRRDGTDVRVHVRLH